MPILDLTPAPLDIRASRLMPMAALFRVTDPVTHAAINLTGWTGEMQVFAVLGGALFLHPTTANGQLSTPGSTGQVTLSVPLVAVAPLLGVLDVPAGDYRYWMRLTGPAGDVLAWSGVFTMDSGVPG